MIPKYNYLVCFPEHIMRCGQDLRYWCKFWPLRGKAIWRNVSKNENVLISFLKIYICSLSKIEKNEEIPKSRYLDIRLSIMILLKYY